MKNNEKKCHLKMINDENSVQVMSLRTERVFRQHVLKRELS